MFIKLIPLLILFIFVFLLFNNSENRMLMFLRVISQVLFVFLILSLSFIILFLTAEEYIIDQNWWSSSMVSPYIIDSANLVGKMIGELPVENIENLTIEPSKLID